MLIVKSTNGMHDTITNIAHSVTLSAFCQNLAMQNTFGRRNETLTDSCTFQHVMKHRMMKQI